MRFPYFAFWVESYWLDAYDLNDAEHGIYLQLLIHTWNAPGCRMPNDDAWIARKMQRSVQDFEKQVKPILLRFYRNTGNWLNQPKLTEEYDRLMRQHKRSSAGGKARQNKEKTQRQTPAARQDLAPALTPTPTPTNIYNPDLPNLNGSSTSPPKPRKKRTALPADFVPDQTYAAKHGMSSAAYQDQVLAFQNHHQAHGKLMADWQSAWRTWVGNWKSGVFTNGKSREAEKKWM